VLLESFRDRDALFAKAQAGSKTIVFAPFLGKQKGTGAAKRIKSGSGKKS